MADLQITQYAGLGRADHQLVQAPDTEGMIVERVLIDATPRTFAATTLPLIEVRAEADCVVSFDGSAAATVDYRMYADQTLMFKQPIGVIIGVKNQA